MARINGINIELPKYTIDIAEKLEEYDEIKTAVFNNEIKYTEGLRRYYDLLGEILGAETTAQVVAGDSINEVDITKLLTAFIEIIEYYKEPIEKLENEKGKKKLKETLGTPEFERVTELASAIKTLND